MVLAISAAIGAPAFAEGYLYGVNATGTVSVNGNKIDGMPSDFDLDYPWWDTDQAWRDMAVIGGNRYTIRGDGLVMRNGEKLWSLNYDSDSAWFWTEVEFAEGQVYALRQNGQLAVNDEVVASLPRNDFFFTSLLVWEGATYSLRSDGSVFKNGGSTEIFRFRAGRGIFDENDGREIDTLWIALKVGPLGQHLYALRADGVLYRGELPTGDEEGELVDSLPFQNDEDDFRYGDLYSDFEFDELGRWVILRMNGRVYREPDALSEDMDFPGTGNEGDEMFVDVEIFDGRYLALRSDGKVYVNDLDDYLVDLPGSAVIRMALSESPPVLADAKNNAPSVVTYTVTVNTGLPVKIPVIAVDVETPAADLVVTPVETPPGSVWDGVTRTLTWTTPDVKGSYTFSYTVDDGADSAKTYKSKIKVKTPEADPAKNKAPYLPKFKGVVALVGIELRLYIPLEDPDGDPVTVTVTNTEYPFSAGAYYNPATSELVWTPTNLDIGKQTLEFVLGDGTTTKTLKVKIEVKSPLFVVELP
jgi:hypothetical protein